MADRLDWATDGADWPNRESSQFLRAGQVHWHVQVAGAGPVLLLLHGTGASTHSWRDLFPLLTPHFTVVAPDLPGHAFSQALSRDTQSLPGMARAVMALTEALALKPALVAGHSAGAAVAARACLDNAMDPAALISLAGAFFPPRSLPGGALFAPLARGLVQLPFVPDLFAWRAGDPAIMARLLRATGSTLDARGNALYARLGRSPAHVRGALTMMAQWDLAPLLGALPRLRPQLHLVTGDRDGTIPAANATTLARRVPGATVLILPGLGHLAHEERPGLIAPEIIARRPS